MPFNTSIINGTLGYLFALIEIIVYEISNGVFLLHCFFIGIYNYLSDKARNKLKNVKFNH